MALRASAILIVYVLLTVSSATLVYGLSVGLGHNNPFLPFFSDIGDQPIESTLFTQCFIINAAVLMLVIQIRFVYVSQMLKRRDMEKAQSMNVAGLFSGYAAASGLFVVACFQESHAYYAHYVALLVYLIGSIVYFGIHTKLSKWLNTLPVLRSLVTALMCVLFLTFFAGYVIAMTLHDKSWEERHHWKREDGGWVSHLVSAASEWFLLSMFQVYFLTFYGEFRSVMLTTTRIIVLAD